MQTGLYAFSSIGKLPLFKQWSGFIWRSGLAAMDGEGKCDCMYAGHAVMLQMAGLWTEGEVQVDKCPG